jgi:hypothetical protein
MKTGIAKVKCKCVHEYQDKMFGAGLRIANTTVKQDKDYVEVRCTVCKTVHRVNPSQVK